jgi:type VI secretion system protein ImpA
MSSSRLGLDLLQSISPESPCGENLEDTPLLLSFAAFNLFGRPTPPDPEKQPDWGEIQTKAVEALARSKDLRLLAYLATAVLRTDGLAAFSEALGVAAQWLEQYWTGVYPVIDEDAIGRSNALTCFGDPMIVVDALRRAPLVRSRQHGTFSLRDIDQAVRQAQAQDTDQTPNPEKAEERTRQVGKAAFDETPIEDLQALQRDVAAAADALKRIDATMREHAGVEATPALEPLSTQVRKLEYVLDVHVKPRIVTPDPDEGDAMPDGSALRGTGAPLGAIASRQDAIRALEAVAEFFRRHEPSSPVPLFVERARRLVSKDFLEVLADIAPDAVSTAKSAGGVRE